MGLHESRVAATTWLLAIVSISLSASAYAQIEAGATPAEFRAQDFVRLLADDQFEDTPPLMDATMNQAMKPDLFRELWRDITAQAGPFETIVGTKYQETQGYLIVHVMTRFEKATLALRVVYDSAGLVSGFFIGAGSTSKPSIEPPYANRDAFNEEDTEIVSGSIRLPATLTIPKSVGPYPVVVLVHGSGPNDRDETIGPNKVFRDLAWGLATLGVASLRYEKRTRAVPDEIDLETLTYREETVDDAVAAVEMVAEDGRFDTERVVVLGHSFGGTLAPLIARESEAAHGIIMMAASTETLFDAVMRQTEYIFRQDETLSDAERSQLESLRDAADKLVSGEGASPIFGGVSKKYIDTLDAYDGPAVAKSLTVPMFIAQGGRDYQVLAEGSFTDWKTALGDKPNVTFKLYPTLDHLFMPGEGPSYPSDYQTPGNVSEQFIRDIADWVKGLAE